MIVLNWNGCEDTLACLDSIRRLDYPNVRTVVVDNGSTDDSVARIAAWAAEKQPNGSLFSYDRAEAEGGGRLEAERSLAAPAAELPLVVVQAGENLGFAGGCNVGLRYALAAGAEYAWLLNNDTVVEPESLGRLVEFMAGNPTYAAVTGQIRYHGVPRIWNCGGDLTWYGSRRYHYGEMSTASVPNSGSRQITFMTGCAALFRTEVFRDAGLLTERFFFGEEDYELSRRFKRLRLPMACTYDAVIQHKVGSSINRGTGERAAARYYLYYLNRFIDMRGYYPAVVWHAWRQASLLYILARLKLANGEPWSSLRLLRRLLLRDSSSLDGVTRDHFERVRRGGLEAL